MLPLQVHLLDTIDASFWDMHGVFWKMAHIRCRLSEISKTIGPHCGHSLRGRAAATTSFLNAANSARSSGSLHVIHVPRLMARQDRHKAAQRHDAQIQADRTDAPMRRELGGYRRDERRADDRRKVVADAGAGVAHVDAEQFRQQRPDRPERDAHEREAEA